MNPYDAHQQRSTANAEKWGKQVATRFTPELLQKLDDLVHRVKSLAGDGYGYSYQGYGYRSWTRSNAIHWLVKHMPLPATLDQIRDGELQLKQFAGAAAALSDGARSRPRKTATSPSKKKRARSKKK